MKSFTTAVKAEVQSSERQDKIDALVAERQNKISALVEEGQTREAAEAKIREEAEREVDNGKPVEFELDGRKMRAYPPTDGQLIFLMASHGRGQTNNGRFSSSVNVILECLDEDDKDHLESRLLSRKEKVDPDVLESIFEHLTEEWFGSDHPTPPSSGSV